MVTIYTYGYMHLKIKIYKAVSTLSCNILIFIFYYILTAGHKQISWFYNEFMPMMFFFFFGKKKPLTRYFSLLKNPFWICEKWCIKSITGAWSLVSKSPKMNTSDYYISCQNTSSIQHLVKLRSLSGVFANVPRWGFITPSSDEFQRSF